MTPQRQAMPSRSMTPMRSDTSSFTETPIQGGRRRRWSRRHEAGDRDSSRDVSVDRCNVSMRSAAAAEAHDIDVADSTAATSAVDEGLSLSPEAECKCTLAYIDEPSVDVKEVLQGLEADSCQESEAVSSEGSVVRRKAASLDGAQKASSAAGASVDVAAVCLKSAAAASSGVLDWPLSRSEKVERVRLIERQMSNLQQEGLMAELEQLRGSRGCNMSR